MKTRPKDVLYCGVNQQKIAKAKPELNIDILNSLFRYMLHRYQAHIQKDVVMSGPPYSDDWVLQQFKFTNVRREHDKESRWVITCIADNNFLTYRQKILNIILFRMYNRHETAEMLGLPILFHKEWSPELYYRWMHIYRRTHSQVFGRAYRVSGMLMTFSKTCPNVSPNACLPLAIIKKINGSKIPAIIRDAKSQDEVTDALQTIDGIGPFTAYQMFVDMTYMPEFQFSENEFTIAGPGAKMGLKLLFKDKDGMTDEECIFWMRDNWNTLNKMVDEEYKFVPKDVMVDIIHSDRKVNVMMLENCLCELSKFVRRDRGLVKPRANVMKHYGG